VTTKPELVPTVAVGGVVLAPGPQVLLVRRGTAPMIGRWTLPGGRVRGGETLIAAVEREVLEETGIRVAADRLIDVVEVMTEGFHYVIHDHLCTPLSPGASPAAADDALEARYAAASELLSLGVSDEVVRVVMKAIALRQAMCEDE
jgi:ADP-ribose pyrophosphatase YjhB (NUDIX family)